MGFSPTRQLFSNHASRSQRCSVSNFRTVSPFVRKCLTQNFNVCKFFRAKDSQTTVLEISRTVGIFVSSGDCPSKVALGHLDECKYTYSVCVSYMYVCCLPHRSESAIIVLDDLHRLVEFTQVGSLIQISHHVLHTLTTLLTLTPPSTSKLLVIGTMTVPEGVASLEEPFALNLPELFTQHFNVPLLDSESVLGFISARNIYRYEQREREREGERERERERERETSNA